MSRYFFVNIPKSIDFDVSAHSKIIEEISRYPGKEMDFNCNIGFDTNNFKFYISPGGVTAPQEVLEVNDIVGFIKNISTEVNEITQSHKPIFLHLPCETFLKKVLDCYNVSNLTIHYDGDNVQFNFPNTMEDNDRIIGALHRLGVGEIYGCFSLLPVDLGQYIQKKEATFSDTVRSRLVLIEQMIRNISDGSEFTFDFVAMILMAGILAGVGLATDNSVVVVASMLVSPLMGPILGMTFGIMIHDWILVKQSILTEFYGLLLCLFSGFLVGICGFALAEKHWPTEQMRSRGDPYNLLVGIAVASPSGIGAALSISSSNTAGVVGVAISASLLPPAVNCGLLITWALLGRAKFGDHVDMKYNLDLAGISLALTIVNIICIIIFGYITFVIKEVANLPGKTSFWNEDVKKIRAEFDVQNHKTAKGIAGAELQKEIDEILRKRNTCCCSRPDYTEVENILKKEGISWTQPHTGKTIASYQSMGSNALQHEINLMSIFNKPNEKI